MVCLLNSLIKKHKTSYTLDTLKKLLKVKLPDEEMKSKALKKIIAGIL